MILYRLQRLCRSKALELSKANGKWENGQLTWVNTLVNTSHFVPKEVNAVLLQSILHQPAGFKMLRELVYMNASTFLS